MVDQHEIETAVDTVSVDLGVERDQIAQFVASYPKTSQVLNYPEILKVHFQAYSQLQERKKPYISWDVGGDISRTSTRHS